MSSKYTSYRTRILDNGKVRIDRTVREIRVEPTYNKKLGVMMVGLGGNNGSTFTAGLLAYQRGLMWKTKFGEQKVELLGSLSQFGTVHIGYDQKGKPVSRLYKDITLMHKPEDIVIGGWDINNNNLYTAAQKSQVIDPSLLCQLEEELSCIVPLPSIFNPDFIATNQVSRVNNVIKGSLRSKIDQLKKHIHEFKTNNELSTVIVLWTASTERFHNGKWSNADELLTAINQNDTEIPPSICFAVAAIESKCIFLNGSPQNTIVPSVINLAYINGTHVGGEDFKTGQTKLKSALVDWLVSSGIRPLSIVSYNHLGNNDGKNLSESPQFHSKEITKKNVIDDVVESNPCLFPDGKPDHVVVIKYVPSVKDSKRAMDEYFSQLFLNGRHTLAIHNTCEDSLLAVPVMLDVVLFADLLSRVQTSSCNDNLDGESSSYPTVLSLLSFFFKAPVVNEGEPLINSFFRQVHGLENFFRVLAGLPPLDHIPLLSL